MLRVELVHLSQLYADSRTEQPVQQVVGRLLGGMGRAAGVDGLAAEVAATLLDQVCVACGGGLHRGLCSRAWQVVFCGRHRACACAASFPACLHMP